MPKIPGASGLDVLTFISIITGRPVDGESPISARMSHHHYTGHYDIPRDATDELREGETRREREKGEAGDEC